LYDSVYTGLNRTEQGSAALAVLTAAQLDDSGGGYYGGLASSAAYDAYWAGYYERASLQLVPLYSGPPPDARWTVEHANNVFTFCAVLHFLNAWQYAYAWHGR
jgi:hypothetical protein